MSTIIETIKEQHQGAAQHNDLKDLLHRWLGTMARDLTLIFRFPGLVDDRTIGQATPSR